MKRECKNKIKRILAIIMTACMLLTVVTVSNTVVNPDDGVAPCCEEVNDSVENA